MGKGLAAADNDYTCLERNTSYLAGNVTVERLHHPSGGEVLLPPAQDYALSLFLGKPLETIQWQEQQVHRERVTRGHITITPVGKSRGWRWWNGDCDVLYLRIHPAFLTQVALEASEGDATNKLLSQFSVRDPHIEQISLSLLAELRSPGKASRLYTESLANLLVVHLLRHYCGKKIAVAGKLPQYKLRCVIDYINAHLEQNLSLSQIAAIAQTSPHHFARQFKQSTGLTPHQYLLRCRIERAKELLLEDLPVTEISYRLSFASPSHFSATFRKWTAVTPTAYRKTLHDRS